MRETVLEAVLRSADAPSEVQRNRFAAFLKKQYGQEVPLRWEQDPALEKGFRMEVGADLYDWSLEGRLRQFRERLEQLNPAGVSVLSLIHISFTSDSGAGRVTERPVVVTACKPSSSNSVPTKIYACRLYTARCV